MLITLMGGMVMMLYTYRMETLLNSIFSKYLTALQTAEALEIALVNQKGFVSYYFIDGDPDWLRQLGEYRQIFKERLHEAMENTHAGKDKVILDQLNREYESYIEIKDRVINYYKSGEKDTGVLLHRKTRDHFFKILTLCQNYKEIHTAKIMSASRDSHDQARNLRFISLAAMTAGFLLALLMAFILMKQILDPVKMLTREADRKKNGKGKENEIKALSRSVYNLIKDVDDSQIELEKSQKHLLEAEKLALVGKLAAGMAHSIRNPFTSVKMRLFSLSRSLEMADAQKEDFDVISEEIRHIDTIVQNFLEFSRPPRLQMQKISPSSVVDSTIQLLEHRLKSYKVSLQVKRVKSLPDIQVDPDQIKEVIVNLVINACEAMRDGGTIVLDEKVIISPTGGRAVVIAVSDNGPGIPSAMQDRVLDPFFTTKEEGTGLGLSIVKRIIEEHGGRLDLVSEEGKGATFIITLAVKEEVFGNDPGY